MKNGRELIINPRVRFASPDVATQPAIDKGSNKRFFQLDQDPQWFYNYLMVRAGIRIPVGGRVGYEPQAQLGYGAFLNKVIKTEDSSGDAFDEYLRLDRRYFSAGIINMLSWMRDYNRLRLKWFVGVGVHLRLYHEYQYAKYLYRLESPDFEPHSSDYWKGRFTFHAGLEIGIGY